MHADLRLWSGPQPLQLRPRLRLRGRLRLLVSDDLNPASCGAGARRLRRRVE